jgi:triacylglycerol esterase/lipase EstA (alpha/beta hydrolase family)
MYKRINAPVGELGLASLQASTIALKSNATNDAIYTQRIADLTALTASRDALVARIVPVLVGAAENNQPLEDAQVQSLIQEAQALLDRAKELSGE